MSSAAAAIEKITLGPQPGPQTAFLETTADIAIYGGAAGGGKTYGLLLEPLRHYHNALFGAVIFRRTSVQVRVEGGLWDESSKIYPLLGAIPKAGDLKWIFPAGWKLRFAHLEHENDKFDWQGAQIPYIGFDELTHFSQTQFFYLLSRNRSMSGVPGYIRATCNPDADSWIRTLIDWWIGADGYPIAERSGRVRWFIRQNDIMTWADSREELVAKYGDEARPKSLTFIPARVHDNKVLIEKDPSYLANLKALQHVDRMRLEMGNWNVRASARNYFRREWFPKVRAVPDGWIQAIRCWDRAATRPNGENPDPDWTRGVLLYQYPKGLWVIGDLKSTRDTPGNVERLITTVASHDGRRVQVMAQQDPGSAGKSEAENFVKMLQGYIVKTYPMTKDKETRAKPLSAQCEFGNVAVVDAPWNEEFFREMENFPEGRHDDIVDAASGAFNELSAGGLSILQVLGGK